MFSNAQQTILITYQNKKYVHVLQNAYGTSSTADPLPTGWEERQDANGTIYIKIHFFRNNY